MGLSVFPNIVSASPQWLSVSRYLTNIRYSSIQALFLEKKDTFAFHVAVLLQYSKKHYKFLPKDYEKYMLVINPLSFYKDKKRETSLLPKQQVQIPGSRSMKAQEGSLCRRKQCSEQISIHLDCMIQ